MTSSARNSPVNMPSVLLTRAFRPSSSPLVGSIIARNTQFTRMTTITMASNRGCSDSVMHSFLMGLSTLKKPKASSAYSLLRSKGGGLGFPLSLTVSPPSSSAAPSRTIPFTSSSSTASSFASAGDVGTSSPPPPAAGASVPARHQARGRSDGFMAGARGRT